MTASTWISIAQLLMPIATLLLIKPLSDLRKDMSELKILLYKEFATNARLDKIEAEVRASKSRGD